jgi:hypothetical protein
MVEGQREFSLVSIFLMAFMTDSNFNSLGSAFGGAIVQHLGWDWVYKVSITLSKH